MAGMGDISSILSDQPLIDDGGGQDEGAGAELEQGTEEHGALDLGGGEPPASTEAPEGKPKGRVPLAALQEERERRQELQEQNRTLMEQNAKMNERFQQFMERMQQPQQPQQPQEQPVEIPAFIDDPEGHINGLRQQLERELTQVRQAQQALMGHQQQSAHVQQLAQTVAASEVAYRAVKPDYDQAAHHFASLKTAEYLAFGYTPEQAQMALMRDYQGIAQASAQRGVSPAETLYKLAQATGYAPQAGGQQPQQAPKQAPTSLSSLGGAPRAPDEQGGVTLESVSNMSDAEFDKFWKQMARGSKQSPKF